MWSCKTCSYKSQQYKVSAFMEFKMYWGNRQQTAEPMGTKGCLSSSFSDLHIHQKYALIIIGQRFVLRPGHADMNKVCYFHQLIRPSIKKSIFKMYDVLWKWRKCNCHGHNLSVTMKIQKIGTKFSHWITKESKEIQNQCSAWVCIIQTMEIKWESDKTDKQTKDIRRRTKPFRESLLNPCG